jgi:hypothetical protein
MGEKCLYIYIYMKNRAGEEEGDDDVCGIIQLIILDS